MPSMNVVVGRVVVMWFKKHAASGDVTDFGIAAGQRFRTNTAPPVLWEVGIVYRHAWEPTPHVRLHRVGMASDVKTIALPTLRDERYFAPVN